MKKLQIALYTLLAVCASLDVHAMAHEPAKVAEPNKSIEQTSIEKTQDMNKKSKENSRKKSQQKADARNNKRFNSSDITSTTSSTVQGEKPTSSSTGISLEDNQASPVLGEKQYDESNTETSRTDSTDTSSTGIPSSEAEASPAVDKTEETESSAETSRTDSTDSQRFESVDLTDEVTAQAQAQNVKDSSTLTSFIKSMVDSFFGKDANNPEVKDGMDKAMSDAQAEQWWSPWDGSKFQRWFDNTMESFKQIKASLPPASLFSSTGTGSAMATQVSSANFYYDSRADSVYKDDISMDPWSSRDSINS
ncbi:hypothetical protein [Candidatus Chromulinivorax destructor]|uniref:Uncharacterized protein n=1 Tax=Candidatus Chromulinivorax destructor TaxID=2066483 RepID=A0A345ZCS1_9BACT|nr:hypothetical protein [Candidatus Chromulinivorax destructor]AXK61088.1 hypothetical protein C0J27_05145 [Candidatus Chromulinivorax destructor]